MTPIVPQTPQGSPPPPTSSTTTLCPAARLGEALAARARDRDAMVAVWHGLARHLEANGAPLPLARAARRAALDGIRHARMLGAMARRHRGTVTIGTGAPSSAWTWDALVLANAIDGCVRQGWDLARTRWAAEHAGDPVLRETMRRIARDMADHVALAWRVHGYAMPRACDATKDRIKRALRATVSALEAEIARGEDLELAAHGLVPPADRASAFFEEIRARAHR